MGEFHNINLELFEEDLDKIKIHDCPFKSLISLFKTIINNIIKYILYIYNEYRRYRITKREK